MKLCQSSLKLNLFCDSTKYFVNLIRWIWQLQKKWNFWIYQVLRNIFCSSLVLTNFHIVIKTYCVQRVFSTWSFFTFLLFENWNVKFFSTTFFSLLFFKIWLWQAERYESNLVWKGFWNPEMWTFWKLQPVFIE